MPTTSNYIRRKQIETQPAPLQFKKLTSPEGVKLTKNPEINFDSSKPALYKKGMPTIRCVCGTKILVVPDLQAMKFAIKKHVAQHKQADSGLVQDSLEEFLTERVLIAASKINLPN